MIKESEEENNLTFWSEHNEKLMMKWLTWDLNICTEWVSSDEHIGHTIKSLKYIHDQAKQNLINTKEQLEKYEQEITKAQDKIVELKTDKENQANVAANKIKDKIKDYTAKQSKRVIDTFSILNNQIDFIKKEKEVLRKLQTDASRNMILDRSFESIDTLNNTITKIQETITTQKYTEAMNYYEQYKNSSVAVENELEELIFTLNRSDFEKSKEQKLEISCESGAYTLSINQNQFNSSTFMLHLKCNCIGDDASCDKRKYPSKSKLNARINRQNYPELNIFISNSDDSLITAEKPEVLVGKILMLSEGIPDSKEIIKLAVYIEELKFTDSNIELDMLIGLQQEITKMIVDICINKHIQ